MKELFLSQPCIVRNGKVGGKKLANGGGKPFFLYRKGDPNIQN